MKKNKLKKEAKSIMKNAKKELRKYGSIVPVSYIFCKNSTFLVEGSYRNTSEKEIYFNVIRKMIKQYNAKGVIFVTNASLKSFPSSIEYKNTGVPLKQDKNTRKAVYLTASIPTYCLMIIQTYSENGDKVEFDDEKMWEPKKGRDTAFSKAFVDVWDDQVKLEKDEISTK